MKTAVYSRFSSLPLGTRFMLDDRKYGPQEKDVWCKVGNGKVAMIATADGEPITDLSTQKVVDFARPDRPHYAYEEVRVVE